METYPNIEKYRFRLGKKIWRQFTPKKKLLYMFSSIESFLHFREKNGSRLHRKARDKKRMDNERRDKEERTPVVVFHEYIKKYKEKAKRKKNIVSVKAEVSAQFTFCIL